MSKSRLPIDTIIAQLGYDNSVNLIRCNQLNNIELSSNAKKIILEVKPYATYIVDGMPFVVFFDKNVSAPFKDTSKRVWNAQIPIAIFCDEGAVKVYNGTSLDLSDYTIRKVKEYALGECCADSDFSFWKITDPLFWDQYIGDYSNSRLNQCLLDNISYLTNELKLVHHIPFATKLVLRLIFIRYLIDRGVDLAYKNFSSDILVSKEEFLRIVKNKNELYELFAYLKSKFNGNLFDLNDELQCKALSDQVFVLLSDFFSGEIALSSGQLSLFSLYDFNIIPVELISNIYEILLGKETQDKDNAFYTPNYLVEYILDKTVTKTLKQRGSFRVLDPACGSGVFLVDSYRRIVEENLSSRYCEDDSLLQKLLSDNIFGVDINDEAIDVTIFSLYLTVLDYKDPKTLFEFRLPNLKNVNLFVSDFFDDSKLNSLRNAQVQFDYIIGNPPWGNVKHGLHMDYCKDNGYSDKQQNNEISRSFVFRAKEFCGDNTTCCFILHSKLLYNQKKPAVNFRKYLLSETQICDITEMSSIRKMVFENADAPAAIVAFKYNQSDNLGNKFCYTSFKPNVFFRLFNILVAEKTDMKSVPQKLLYDFDWAWKTIVYGFSGDVENILRMKSHFNSIKSMLKNQTPKLIYGSGIQDHLGDAQDASSLLGLPILDSDCGVDHFALNVDNNEIFDTPKIHRIRKRDLFRPPHCFTAKGLNCSNYKMRSVFSDKELVCKETMYIIKGAEEQTDILYNLVGLLNSSFFAYLNLMIGSSVGIEREQRFMSEVLSFPYTFSPQIVEKVKALQRRVSPETHFCLPPDETDVFELDQLVLSEFGLERNNFVDYALRIQIPELTNSHRSGAYEKVTVEDLKRFVDCFAKQFSMVYNQLGKYISIVLYPNIVDRFAAFELLIVDKKDDAGIRISSENDNLALLSRFSVFSYNDKFHQMRDVIYFRENSFYIIKPNYLKYWHPAIAEVDLADAVDQIMVASGGEG